MQKKSYTIGSLIILLICAFVFVIVPVMSGRGSKQEEAPLIGKYAGKEIRYTADSDFANAVSNYANLFQSNGSTIDTNTSFYIYTYAFNATVAQMAYTKAIEDSGYEVSEKTLNRQLANNFVDENGNYSDKIYRMYLNQNPQGINEMRSSTKKSLTSSRFLNDHFGEDDFFGDKRVFGEKSSDAELAFLSTINSDKRGFEVTTLDMTNYPDEEKAAFGKANSSKFVKYDMSVITVADESTAKKVADRIAKNEITFEDAVAEYSTKDFSGSSGSLYYAYNYQIQGIVDSADALSEVTKLSEGEISGIIPTVADNGSDKKACFSIFRSNAPAVNPDFSSEDTLSVVYNYLYSKEKTILEDYYSKKANELLTRASETDYETACEEFNATFSVMNPIPLNYGDSAIAATLDKSITGLEAASEDENFWKTAFSLKKGEWSSPIVLDDYVVLLHYTTDGEAETDSVTASSVMDIDQQVANQELMSSSKVENNVLDFVFSNLNY